ncbi:hypothetical protein MPER_12817 [Moniliophthora perniciosa FA553]|nr:hypothetical protein MPER_12817 [Moniliophthora perniciosa FA553]
MAELAQLLSSIEDWESYQVVTPVVSDESDKTIEEGPSVASIKENLSDALSFKLDSEVDPNRLPQLKKLHRVFSVWRQTLDDKEEQVPHLLIYRLDEDYGDVEVESLYASLLKGTDRILLCQVAPVAKAYGFNLHFGEAKYMESGYPKTTPRNDSETQNSRENGMDVDSDDDSRSEESFVELEEMDYELDMNDQCFSVENVTKMNGFPLEMKSVELEKLGGYEAREESRRLIINGDVTDRKPRSEFEDYMEPYDTLSSQLSEPEIDDDSHVAWSSRCLLISPNDTNEVAFSPSNEVVAYACTLLSISHSTIPTAKESEIINSAIEWLSKNPPLGNLFNGSALTVSCVVVPFGGTAKKLFVDVFRFCGERKVIGTIVGVEPLVAGCQVFQWSEINNWYDQAMSNSSSFRFRYELVKQILASTTDDNIMVWGSSKISTFVDDLGKVEVNDIEAVVSWLRSQRHPIHILRDQLTPRLSAQQSDDMEVWAALFSRLHDGPDGSNFDKAELLSVIQDTLRHMADTVDPLRSHVVSLVELCARYEVMAALNSVFRRMWGDSRQNSWPDLLWQLNTTLISGFEGLAEKDPRMKKFLTRVFFGQAFEYLLSNYSGNNKSSLKKIAKYLDDPVDNLLKYRSIMTFPLLKAQLLNG